MMNGKCFISVLNRWAYLFVVLVVASFANEARSQSDYDVGSSIENALLNQDWEKVNRLIESEYKDSIPPVLRMIKGHATLALNKNNESAELFKDSGSIDDYSGWLSWSTNLFQKRSDSPVAALFKGDALARMNKHNEAIKVFTTGLQKNPGHALILNARAVSYTSLQKWNEAILDIYSATKSDPSLADIHSNKGALNIRRSLGAPGALRGFNKALDISPNHVLARIGKASALYGMGDWASAQEILDEMSRDKNFGHIAAINAAIIRDALSTAELVVLEEKSAGVAISIKAREKQAKLQSLNKEILKSDLSRIRNTFVADTFTDFAKPVKAFVDTYTGLKKIQKGDMAGAVSKFAGVVSTIGKNASKYANSQGQLSKINTQRFNNNMNELRSLSTSGQSGGVSTEDIRRSFVDKGDWGLLSRFLLQYPIQNVKTALEDGM